MLMNSIRKHLSYANVMATVAMALALGGGTALALSGKNTVNSGDIINGEVKSGDAKDNGIKGEDVKNGSLEDQDLGLVSTGSFNLGDVSGGSCVSAANLSIPGADEQDLLLVTPVSPNFGDYDTTGELIMLGIPHPGEGHIKVCNVSNANIDPGNIGYRVILVEG
jgi:hypothetical protein